MKDLNPTAEGDKSALQKCSARLLELSTENGYNSKSLSKELNVDHSVVYRWTKSTSPDLSHLLKLANFFECSLEYLVGGGEYRTVQLRVRPPFSEQLRKVMREKKMTDYYIYKFSKISRSLFAGWYRGSEPNLVNLIKLAGVLDVTLDHLVGIEG